MNESAGIHLGKLGSLTMPTNRFSLAVLAVFVVEIVPEALAASVAASPVSPCLESGLFALGSKAAPGSKVP